MIQIMCPRKNKLCSNFHKKGKTSKGTQRYACKECGITTVGDNRGKRTSEVTWPCKKCGAKTVVKFGTYESYTKRQRYRCQTCKKTFSYDM